MSDGELLAIEELPGTSEENSPYVGEAVANAFDISGAKPGSRASPSKAPDAADSRVLLGLLVSLSAVGLLVRRWWHRRRSRDSVAALLDRSFAKPRERTEEATGAQSLTGRRLVCSGLFDVDDRGSEYAESSSCTSTAELIVQLQNAGAQLEGRTRTEELHLGLLGDSEDAVNPAAPECSINGSSSGIAAVVASGAADIGVGADALSGVRVQSAVFGLSGFRPTPGHALTRGYTSVTGSSESTGWLVRDPALHVQIAEALRLPGALSSFSNTELVKLVVASEVFERHGRAGTRLRAVALSAARRWAGAEQTASGLLVSYLRSNVPSYAHFVGYDNDSDDVMEGILRAAVTLQYAELLQRHGHRLEEPGALRPSVLEQMERAQEVGEEEVQAAEEVAKEASTAMRHLLKGNILILPTLPTEQPAQGSNEEELKAWEKGTLQLAALATLSGCPQATLPVPSHTPGCPPLSLSLMSLPKTDQRLAQVAAALGPLVLAAAGQKPGKTQRLAGHSPGTPNGRQAAAQEDTATQDEFKRAGNEAFKAGRFQEAIEQYSYAIKASPATSNSILYSNRAQALIKIGQFSEAERDCTKALRAGPNAKALLRRGTARAAVSNLEGAVQDFQHVLALEPSNRQARMELQNLKQLSNNDLDDFGRQHVMGGVPH